MQGFDDQFKLMQNDVDHRLNQQDHRIDQEGAMSAALVNMAMNAANGRSPRGRLGVAAGFQNGATALSLGYSKQIGERASFSIGGAASSDDTSIGAGFGIDL